MQNKNTTGNRKAQKNFLLILAIVLFLCSAVYMGHYFWGQYAANQEESTLSSIAATKDATANKIDNPIDFDSLQEKNDEIYAWIKVDGTKVDYPIVQSADDDSFYLRHSAIDKRYISSGAVYTERHNTKTFSDFVTLVYGHNGYSESMFTTLHKFKDADFFLKNEYFYIYMPQRKCTYQIVSAFKYDDRHIMNSFDFQDVAVLDSFQKMLLSPSSSVKNVRENLKTQLNSESKIIVLSTCITGQKSSRYLVCGVMIKDEQTN